MHPMTKRACDMITHGLQKFGEYSYYDKGPEEVLDMDPFVTDLRALPGDEVGQILSAILKTEHGRPFVTSVLVAMQDVVDDTWNAIMAYEDVEAAF